MPNEVAQWYQNSSSYSQQMLQTVSQIVKKGMKMQ